MTRIKKRSCAGLFLFVAFLCLGAAIIWIGIPVLVEKSFGPPISSLTPWQTRQYGLRIWLSKEQLLNPNEGGNTAAIPFEIKEGSSVTQIAGNFEKAGLIQDGKRFRDYLIYKGLDSKIRSGEYSIPGTATPIEIANLIRSDNPIVSLYIYPGWRTEEIGDSLEIAGIGISEQEFIRVVITPASLDLPIEFKNLDTLEGFLFPGQYQIKRDISAEDLVVTLVQRFITEAKPQIDAGMSKTGLTMPEIVTMASIIQRESLVDDERPSIASVFYNRLDAGMKLETDPTIQYAIGYSSSSASWWKNPLDYADLGFESPFNTYLNYGLPPHPISNPDLDAILAVLHRAETPYFYFRANCDGSGTHVFSITFEEHVSKSCQ